VCHTLDERGINDEDFRFDSLGFVVVNSHQKTYQDTMMSPGNKKTILLQWYFSCSVQRGLSPAFDLVYVGTMNKRKYISNTKEST